MAGYLANAGEDAWQGVQHFVVGETQDGKATPNENGVALMVGLVLILVNWPVDLDHQRERVAIEIDDEAVDDLLPTKLPPTEPIRAQFLPQSTLGGGHLATQRLRLLALLSGDTLRGYEAHEPLPRPLP